MFYLPPPHHYRQSNSLNKIQQAGLYLTICSAFSFSTVVSANEFNVENFPDLATHNLRSGALSHFA